MDNKNQFEKMFSKNKRNVYIKIANVITDRTNNLFPREKAFAADYLNTQVLSLY